MSNDNLKQEIRIVNLDAGLHLEWIEARHALLAAVIAEWERSCGKLAELRITVHAHSGFGHADAADRFLGSFEVKAEGAIDEAFSYPTHCVPVYLSGDDGAGADRGYALVTRDGRLDLEATKQWLHAWRESKDGPLKDNWSNGEIPF